MREYTIRSCTRSPPSKARRTRFTPAACSRPPPSWPLLDWCVPLERELKFSVAEGYVPNRAELEAAFLGEPYDVARAEDVSVFDRYLDDASGSLRHAGLAVRIRTAAGSTVATLKVGSASDGALHERDELELPMAGERLPDPIRARVALEVDPETLQVRVELHTERTVYPIELEGTRIAYLSFDDVEARRPAGPWGAHFHEVEVEAVDETDAEVLEAIAARVRPIVELAANSSTKLERAEALLSLYGD